MNNPITLTDPSGRVVLIPAILAIGAFAGGIANLVSYLLSTPNCSWTWESALGSFGTGFIAGGIGTGVTLLIAALLPTTGFFSVAWVSAGIAGGAGGVASTIFFNILTGRPALEGGGQGFIVGSVSAGIASRIIPLRPGPAPTLSWTKGWPLSNANIGPKSIDTVLEEIMQDVIGSVSAIIIGGDSP